MYHREDASPPAGLEDEGNKQFIVPHVSSCRPPAMPFRLVVLAGKEYGACVASLKLTRRCILVPMTD